MTKIVKFRPHHFLCTIAYQGMGYSKAFVENYDLIAKQLLENPNTKIQIVTGLDDICSACPQKIPQFNICQSQNKIAQLDQAHADILDLQDQKIITFAQAKNKIKQQMSLKHFHQACKPCEWKAIGVCEDALKKILHSN